MAFSLMAAAVIVGAGFAGSFYLKTAATVTDTETVGASLILSNPSSGLRLSVVIEPTGQVYGGNYTVTATITNVLSTPAALKADELVDPFFGPCPLDVATGLNLYSGALPAAAIPTASPLPLYNPDNVYSCPTENTQEYSLSPGGGITETSVISGYWANSSQGYVHTYISAGVYTVDVFDAWNQSIVGYFYAAYPANTFG